MNICSITNIKQLKVNPNWARVGILGYYRYNNNIQLF